jgi:hypothetical protein
MKLTTLVFTGSVWKSLTSGSGSRYSSVSILAIDSTSGVRFPAGARELTLLFNVQTGSETGPTTGVSLPGVTRPGREGDDSPPSNAEIKNDGAVSPLIHASLYSGA